MEQHTHHSQNGSNGSSGVALVSVGDASEILGITTSAVRKRINRGKLSARKVDGQWHVVLDEEHLLKASAGESASLAAARRQLEAIRDEWLQPFIMRVGSQAEQIGRLEERIRNLERERDLLVAERNQLRAFLASQPGHEEPPGPGRSRNDRGIAAGLRLTDQVALAGIGLSMGLWLILGVVALLMVG